MADNSNLSAAKSAKNDEFYTQYSDIEAEMNAYYEYNHDVFRGKTILLPCDDPEWSNFTKYFAANFTRFGLKKLISTSYAQSAGNQQLTLFEQDSPLFDKAKHATHGKLFTLTHDTDRSGKIDEYMAAHRNDTNIKQMQDHFDTVISWIDSVFDYTGSEMCGQDWGTLYMKYHKTAYKKSDITQRVSALMGDSQITNRRGIFEYILGGEKDTSLLNVRVFDEKTKRLVYERQTKKALANHISNCPLCALGNDNNSRRIYKIGEMDADHVTAWSKGGATNAANCQMLCKTHNRAKGNR